MLRTQGSLMNQLNYRKIIRYFWSIINTYSSSHMNDRSHHEFGGTYYSCERREYAFIVLREYTIISLNYNIGFLWSLISPRINQLLVFMYNFFKPHFFLHFLQSTSIFQHIFSKNFLAKKQINCFQMNTQVVFTISLKSQFFLLFSLFLLLFMDLLHFLILFMGFTVLFQLLFSFIYSTFSKKFSISVK